MTVQSTDVIIIGAGAAGLMCAREAGIRGRRVTLLEKTNRPGKKILMSGGGRCNFTNYNITPNRYLSQNPHFCKSALSRYTQWDFIELVNSHNIPFHEKAHGELFCDLKSQAILNMLLQEVEEQQVSIHTQCTIQHVTKQGDLFLLQTSQGEWQCESLVIASGGLSIPTLGSSGFGYQIAEQFGLPLIPTRAALVPFTLTGELLNQAAALSGVSVPASVTTAGTSFKESLLFTHRGLSGPPVLQLSSYWREGQPVELTLLPEVDVLTELKELKQRQPLKQLNTVLQQWFPKRLVDVLLPTQLLPQKLADCSHAMLEQLAKLLQRRVITPAGTEGYRTAEVTLGGVDTQAISSKTMQAQAVPGLFFIGEVLDVTGWLGGYNFQWAWSSGWAAGQAV